MVLPESQDKESKQSNESESGIYFELIRSKTNRLPKTKAVKKKLFSPNKAPSVKFYKRRGKTLQVWIPAPLSNNMMTSPTSNGMGGLSCGSTEASAPNQIRGAVIPEMMGDISEISTSD